MNVLKELIKHGRHADLWATIAVPMLDRKPHKDVAQQLAAAGLLSYVDTQTVLAWVGKNTERGILAANSAGPRSSSTAFGRMLPITR